MSAQLFLDDAEQEVVACLHCAGPRRGRYDLTCGGCCLALLREAPAGGPRRATYAFLLMRCSDEQIEAVTAAARVEGLTR